MRPTLAIIAALPREIQAVVRGLKPHPAFRQRAVFLYELPHAIVVAGGMGQHRAALALEAARAVAPITTVVSTGLAGACTPELKVGTIAEAATVIDLRTGERFHTSTHSEAEPQHTLVTGDAIAGVAEKARLARSYNAAMVDMEAATLARLSIAHSLRFRAIKAISDAHGFELPSLSRFADRDGHFRTLAFALRTALHPAEWGRAAELGRDSALALRALDAALRQAMERHGQD